MNRGSYFQQFGGLYLETEMLQAFANMVHHITISKIPVRNRWFWPHMPVRSQL